MQPDTIPHIPIELHGCACEITIELDCTRLCPVTENPQPGSHCTVRYTPTAGRAIKPDYARAYLRQFAGYDGRRVGSMEEVFALLARACAESAAVPVVVEVRALIHDSSTQAMRFEAEP
jgi:hypothetical protein